MFLLLPKDAPYSKQRFTQTPRDKLYGPNLAIISKEYQINVPITKQLTSNCYRDAARTVPDRIALIPTLVVFDQRHISYINMTADSSKDWFFDWNSSTTNLPFNFVVYSKNGACNSFTLDVVAICTDSYCFTSQNMVFNFANIFLIVSLDNNVNDSSTNYTVSNKIMGTVFHPS
jgi:hypothetical protein